LPWYQDTGLPRDEEDYYRATQKFSYYRKAPATLNNS
jgi:hypothetical protein